MAKQQCPSSSAVARHFILNRPSSDSRIAAAPTSLFSIYALIGLGLVMAFT
jgi:hypothetical protein